MRRLIGKGSDQLIPELIGRYDAAIAERKTAIFMQRYLPTVRAFPGVEPLLQKLKTLKLRLAVASSAAEDELDALLEVAHAKRYFDVGDTPYDAEAARRAGVVFVGLRCGGWRDAELQPASAVYDDPADLPRNLDFWLGPSRHRDTL